MLWPLQTTILHLYKAVQLWLCTLHAIGEEEREMGKKKMETHPLSSSSQRSHPAGTRTKTKRRENSYNKPIDDDSDCQAESVIYVVK